MGGKERWILIFNNWLEQRIYLLLSQQQQATKLRSKVEVMIQETKIETWLSYFHLAFQDWDNDALLEQPTVKPINKYYPQYQPAYCLRIVFFFLNIFLNFNLITFPILPPPYRPRSHTVTDARWLIRMFFFFWRPVFPLWSFKTAGSGFRMISSLHGHFSSVRVVSCVDRQWFCSAATRWCQRITTSGPDATMSQRSGTR